MDLVTNSKGKIHSDSKGKIHSAASSEDEPFLWDGAVSKSGIKLDFFPASTN